MSSETVKRGKVIYSENELLVGLEMIESLEKITDLMLYFLDREKIKFSYILIQSDTDDFESWLRGQKRETDILIPIKGNDPLYAIVCQETDVEGGYRFAERITRLLSIEKQTHPISCNVMTVSSSRYTVHQIIFRLYEYYMKTNKQDPSERAGGIDFSSLS